MTDSFNLNVNNVDIMSVHFLFLARVLNMDFKYITAIESDKRIPFADCTIIKLH